MDEQAEATLIDWVINNHLTIDGKKEVSRSFDVGEDDRDLRIVVNTINKKLEKEKITFRISTVSKKDFLKIQKKFEKE